MVLTLLYQNRWPWDPGPGPGENGSRSFVRLSYCAI